MGRQNFYVSIFLVIKYEFYFITIKCIYHSLIFFYSVGGHLGRS